VAAGDALVYADLRDLASGQVLSQASSGITVFNLTVEDRLPSGLTFVSASGGGVYDPSTRTIRWLLGSLDSGASATLTYTVTVDATGDWTNAACAAGNDQSGNLTSDCANATVVGGAPTPTPTPTPAPTNTPLPTSTPTSTPTSAPVVGGGAVSPNTPTPTPTPPPALAPGPTSTPTPPPGAVAPLTPTPTPTPTPSQPAPPTAPAPAPRPTLTEPEVDVLGEVVDIVEQREAGVVPQVPIQLPGR
jgi:hypothetical protein